MCASRKITRTRGKSNKKKKTVSPILHTSTFHTTKVSDGWVWCSATHKNFDLGKRGDQQTGIQRHFEHYRLFGGGVPLSSSPALRFPSPMTTFVRSAGTGVPPFRGDDTSTAVEEILENPGRGAGEPLLEVAAPEAGAGLALYVAGAGKVMKPVASSCDAAVFSAFFFLFFFSVFPLANG